MWHFLRDYNNSLWKRQIDIIALVTFSAQNKCTFRRLRALLFSLVHSFRCFGGGKGTQQKKSRDVRRQAYRRKFRMDLLWLAKGAEGLVRWAGGRGFLLFFLRWDGSMGGLCAFVYLSTLAAKAKPGSGRVWHWIFGTRTTWPLYFRSFEDHPQYFHEASQGTPNRPATPHQQSRCSGRLGRNNKLWLCKQSPNGRRERKKKMSRPRTMLINWFGWRDKKKRK